MKRAKALNPPELVQRAQGTVHAGSAKVKSVKCTQPSALGTSELALGTSELALETEVQSETCI